MERQTDYVLRTVEERGVRLIRLWFTDVLGHLKSFAISPAELEAAFEEGMQFDGSAIDGFSRIQESDVLAMPDATTFELLPWGTPGERDSSAAMFCDIVGLDGNPFAGDPRQVLKRNLATARDRGFTFMAAPELEYFYFAESAADRAGSSGPPVPLDTGSYFDLTTTDVANDLRRKTIHMLEALGIPVEYSFHEDSPSQHEIDLRYTDALAMADNVMACRLVVREIAQQAGVHATFMPKPLEGVQGSGMHTHVSLFEGDTNAFHDPSDPYQLSEVAKAFMAGVLRHAREMTAVTNQLVNSYKRLIRGTGHGSQTQFEAPVFVSWGRNNRSALVRVPVTKRGKSTSTRLEYRAPDPACNPYLAFSAILAAGLRGIEHGYELPPESEANVWAMTDAERAAEGIEPLPSSLAEAIDCMEQSELMAETLGEHIFEWFLRNKRAEWDLYRAQVTPFELDRYLGELVSLVEPLLVFPDPPPPVLSQGLDLAGYPWSSVSDEADVARLEPDDGWPGAVIVAVTDPEGAFALCRALRKGDVPLDPLLLVVANEQLGELEMRDDLFDDFCVLPFQAAELDARLRHLFHKTGRGARPELVEYGELALNLETYQAVISGRPLDLTYMEYELLKFLASHPGKVFTRETLLSRVWGYEYYGGARTVDVHVRRLRAKLGEEHASLIQTVRSVGYRFGQSRWMG